MPDAIPPTIPPSPMDAGTLRLSPAAQLERVEAAYRACLAAHRSLRQDVEAEIDRCAETFRRGPDVKTRIEAERVRRALCDMLERAERAALDAVGPVLVTAEPLQVQSQAQGQGQEVDDAA